MLFTDSVFAGIDPTSGNKSFTYAALDKDLNILALADGEMEDVTAFFQELIALKLAKSA